MSATWRFVILGSTWGLEHCTSFVWWKLPNLIAGNQLKVRWLEAHRNCRVDGPTFLESTAIFNTFLFVSWHSIHFLQSFSSNHFPSFIQSLVDDWLVSFNEIIWLVDWLIDWLIWLLIWLVALIHRSIEWLIGWLIKWFNWLDFTKHEWAAITVFGSK